MGVHESFRDKKILVTGGGGYLATNLVARLSNAPCHIIRLDRAGTRFVPMAGSSSVNDIERDIREKDSWDSIAPRPQNLASPSSLPRIRSLAKAPRRSRARRAPAVADLLQDGQHHLPQRLLQSERVEALVEHGVGGGLVVAAEGREQAGGCVLEQAFGRALVLEGGARSLRGRKALRRGPRRIRSTRTASAPV